jgi:hypothetical protein
MMMAMFFMASVRKFGLKKKKNRGVQEKGKKERVPGLDTMHSYACDSAGVPSKRCSMREAAGISGLRGIKHEPIATDADMLVAPSSGLRLNAKLVQISEREVVAFRNGSQ